MHRARSRRSDRDVSYVESNLPCENLLQYTETYTLYCLLLHPYVLIVSNRSNVYQNSKMYALLPILVTILSTASFNLFYRFVHWYTLNISPLIKPIWRLLKNFVYLQQLSLDVDGGLEAAVLPVVTKLDALFMKFQEMIKNEILKTNLVSVGSLLLMREDFYVT